MGDFKVQNQTPQVMYYGQEYISKVCCGSEQVWPIIDPNEKIKFTVWTMTDDWRMKDKPVSLWIYADGRYECIKQDENLNFTVSVAGAFIKLTVDPLYSSDLTPYKVSYGAYPIGTKYELTQIPNIYIPINGIKSTAPEYGMHIDYKYTGAVNDNYINFVCSARWRTPNPGNWNSGTFKIYGDGRNTSGVYDFNNHSRFVVSWVERNEVIFMHYAGYEGKLVIKDVDYMDPYDGIYADENGYIHVPITVFNKYKGGQQTLHWEFN